MKLARFETDGLEQTGIVVGDDVVGLDGFDDGSPTDVTAILAGGTDLWSDLQEYARSATTVALDAVRLLAPVPRPSKFLAVGMNSADHAREIQEAPRSPEVVAVIEASQHLKAAFPEPQFPSLFNKQTNCVSGPHDPIWLPRDSEQTDYEGEVAAVIGSRVRRASLEEAQAAIAGYTVTNDVSVRDWQWNTSQIWLGKSFDTHGPIGPWVVTADEFDPREAIIRTWVNGELRQEGALAEQTLGPAEIVALISRVCTLEPGDLIATGTPGGIGGISGRFLAAGDEVRVAVTGIGEIRNVVIDEPISRDVRAFHTSAS